jgi:transposase InsO family protein
MEVAGAPTAAAARGRAAARTKTRGTRTGYVYVHSAIDGYSRLAYTEALADEKAVTAVAFLDRARDWFAAHGITYIERIVTDNGACYRAEAFAAALNGSRHQRITPSSCGLHGLDRDAGGLRTKPSPRRRFGFCSSVSSS